MGQRHNLIWTQTTKIKINQNRSANTTGQNKPKSNTATSWTQQPNRPSHRVVVVAWTTANQNKVIRTRSGQSTRKTKQMLKKGNW